MTERIASVRVAVNVPDAEGIWVVMVPVYDGESLTAAVREAGDRVIDSLAKNAGTLYASRVAYGKGLIR